MKQQKKIFTIEDLERFNVEKTNNYSYPGEIFFAGRCLLDVLEFLRCDLKKSERFGTVKCAHAIRLSLCYLKELELDNIIQIYENEIIETFVMIRKLKTTSPPHYGDDFWDWSYILEALAETTDFYPNLDINNTIIKNEINEYFNSVKHYLTNGLTFKNEKEWFGPAVYVAAYKLLLKRGNHIQEFEIKNNVLYKLKEQALKPVENGTYLGEKVAPAFHQWHLGQVVAEFPTESGHLIKDLVNLESLNTLALEEFDKVYALSRIIQGLQNLNNYQNIQNEAKNRLMSYERIDRCLGMGLVAGNIKASLNALEAIWPIVMTEGNNKIIIKQMLNSFHSLRKTTNTIGIVVAVDREAEECLKSFKLASNKNNISEENSHIIIDGERYRVIIKRFGKSIMAAQNACTDLINEHQVKWLIMVGIAGSLGIYDETKDFIGPKKGDVIVASSVVPYKIRRKERSKSASVDVPYEGQEWNIIPTSPNLYKIAHKVSFAPNENKTMYKTHEGTIVTFPGIADNPEMKKDILDKFPGSLAVGEDGYPVVFHGLINCIPTIEIRGISDLAQGDKENQKKNEYQEDLEQRTAARNATDLVVKMIQEISQSW